MALQTEYKEFPAHAYAGMIADTGPNDLFSRSVEDAAGIGFGVPVQQGTADAQCKLMAAGATDCIGITVRDQSTIDDKFKQRDSALIMRMGTIWATVTDAGGVSAGEDVWVKLSDGTFSNADVGSSGSIKLAGCRWESSAANGALAKIRVNMDVPPISGAA